MLYTFLYLIAIVAANLTTAHFSRVAPDSTAHVTTITAFVFISLDLTTRDKLHDAWRGRRLFFKMALLIGAGSVLSWMLNRNAGQIALASFVAFAVSATVDALVYHYVRGDQFERVNWSNLASAAVDSVLFPALAFGWPPSAEIVYGQSTAKVAGGLIWSLILYRIGRFRKETDERNLRAKRQGT